MLKIDSEVPQLSLNLKEKRSSTTAQWLKRSPGLLPLIKNVGRYAVPFQSLNDKYLTAYAFKEAVTLEKRLAVKLKAFSRPSREESPPAAGDPPDTPSYFLFCFKSAYHSQIPKTVATRVSSPVNSHRLIFILIFLLPL